MNEWRFPYNMVGKKVRVPAGVVVYSDAPGTFEPELDVQQLPRSVRITHIGMIGNGDTTKAVFWKGRLGSKWCRLEEVELIDG
jgi:hypothetical protein